MAVGPYGVRATHVLSRVASPHCSISKAIANERANLSDLVWRLPPDVVDERGNRPRGCVEAALADGASLTLAGARTYRAPPVTNLLKS